MQDWDFPSGNRSQLSVVQLQNLVQSQRTETIHHQKHARQHTTANLCNLCLRASRGRKGMYIVKWYVVMCCDSHSRWHQVMKGRRSNTLGLERRCKINCMGLIWVIFQQNREAMMRIVVLIEMKMWMRMRWRWGWGWWRQQLWQSVMAFPKKGSVIWLRKPRQLTLPVVTCTSSFYHRWLASSSERSWAEQWSRRRQRRRRRRRGSCPAGCTPSPPGFGTVEHSTKQGETCFGVFWILASAKFRYIV